MIVYRKAAQLRVKRATAPEPPFWGATIVTPYSARRAAPIAIDYNELRATATERLEVSVSERTIDELERSSVRIVPPVVIDATEFAEAIFRRGEEVLEFCEERDMSSIYLVSTRGVLPERERENSTTVIAAWPLDFDRIQSLFDEARGDWGVAVPVMFPVTTNLTALDQLAESAKSHGAQFLAAVPIALDATAKQAIARSMSLENDDETYNMLFHANLDPLHVATERHIAAVAKRLDMADFVVPPRWEEPTNWNASILLTLTATRMLAMEHEIDLAALLARSARVVAELDKPIARIAEAASLSIVGALDEVSVDLLTEWLERGTSSFVERINARWRLRRNAGAQSAEGGAQE